MTQSIDFNATSFLSRVNGRSFTFIGIAILVRCHLIQAPAHRLTREEVAGLLRCRSEHSVKVLGDVLDGEFEADENDRVYSPSIDRAIAVRQIPVSAP